MKSIELFTDKDKTKTVTVIVEHIITLTPDSSTQGDWTYIKLTNGHIVGVHNTIQEIKQKGGIS